MYALFLVHLDPYAVAVFIGASYIPWTHLIYVHPQVEYWQ